jgi:putative membrane protein
MKTIQVGILALMLVASTGLIACSDRTEADREGYALADDPNFLTAAEKDFILYASEMHVGEIALAQQAKQKSSNEGVTKYADAVIKTHTDALAQLSDKTEGIAEPSKTASDDTEGHAEYLAPLSGAQFDKEFVDLMVADHKSAYETFNAESAAAQNSNLKGYMKDAASTLQDRWDEASDLQKKLASQVSQR